MLKKIIDLNKFKEEKNKKYDMGIMVCLECGFNMKYLVEQGASYRKLECEKCKKYNSLFFDIDLIEELIELNNRGDI